MNKIVIDCFETDESQIKIFKLLLEENFVDTHEGFIVSENQVCSIVGWLNQRGDPYDKEQDQFRKDLQAVMWQMDIRFLLVRRHIKSDINRSLWQKIRVRGTKVTQNLRTWLLTRNGLT